MGKKVISFSLYGDDPKYYLGAEKNIEEAKEIYPDWTLRFYCTKDIPNLEKLKNIDSIEVITLDEKNDIPPVYARFLVIDEDGVDVVLIRDCDSIINLREKAAVEEWLTSNKVLHTMHDHNAGHYDPIMAGMWGIKIEKKINIKEKIYQYIYQNNKLNYRYRDDQHFLKEYILNEFKDSWIDHNSTSKFRFESSVDFPNHMKIKYGKFVGQIIYPTYYLYMEKRNKNKLFIMGHQAEMDHLYLFSAINTLTDKYEEIAIFVKNDRKDFCNTLYNDVFKNIKLVFGHEKVYLQYYNNVFGETHDFLGLGQFNKNSSGADPYNKESILKQIENFLSS